MRMASVPRLSYRLFVIATFISPLLKDIRMVEVIKVSEMKVSKVMHCNWTGKFLLI